MRGTQLVNQLTENQSVEAMMSDMISKTAGSSGENVQNDNFGLCLALFAAQKTTLFDEKERLRYVQNSLNKFELERNDFVIFFSLQLLI